MTERQLPQEFNSRYTVLQQAKVDREKPSTETNSIWLPISKWFIAGVLFLIVLSCVLASKLTLVSLAINYNDAENIDEKGAIALMMILMLMTPQALSLLKSLWSNRKKDPWPTKRALVWCFIGSTCEALGLCFFFIIATVVNLSGSLYIVQMNGLFLIPVFWQVWKKKNEICDIKDVIQMILFCICVVLQIGGIIGTVFWVTRYDNNLELGYYIYFLPLSLVLISIAWCPKIRKLQIKPRPNPYDLEEDPIEELIQEPQNNENPQEVQSPPVVPMYRAKNARSKATMIMSAWKLLLTLIAAVVACGVFKITTWEELPDKFNYFNSNGKNLVYFIVHLCSSFVGYLAGMLACAMCMQRVAFALPLALATPLAILITKVPEICEHLSLKYSENNKNYSFVILIALALWGAQLISTSYFVWKNSGFIMAKESALFWVPSYNGVFLEQFMLLNRKNKFTEHRSYLWDHQQMANDSYVYICTTMYRESEQEMEQLLRSIHLIDKARGVRQFESHIFFDGCVKGGVMNDFVLMLISLIGKTLKVNPKNCMKMETPYGMQMRWKLPGGLLFHIHMKDNLKVKNKKRWSQIMYMSYVLDFKEPSQQDDYTLKGRDYNTYILTTDADVMFNPASVEALLDIMIADPTLGAVCGRTHPLGSGPLVWYQTFDYAIGHWFQKVANDVLGSVLCCPGCFSVYRARALRDVVPLYGTKVNKASEFLIKDMGEDRWLCTLMVQAGWRLQYCAAAENSTFCPDNFDEFFNQRRRWIPSTMANLVELCSKWRMIVENNDDIHPLFIFYQMAMLFSTCISPATVIVIIIGSLEYANIEVSEITALTFLLIITVGYTMICLYTPQKFQLLVAKVLTFMFAIIMAVVAVGIAAQVAIDIDHRIEESNKNTTGTTSVPSLEDKLPANVSTIYLLGLIAMFVMSALLHPLEAYCLIHGLWYLLCLPSGYLLLIIYSMCNLTDKSWGTREAVKKDEGETWQQMFAKKFRYIMSCCRQEPPKESNLQVLQPPTGELETSTSSLSPESSETDSGSESTQTDQHAGSVPPDEHVPPPSSPTTSILKRKQTGVPTRKTPVFAEDKEDGRSISSPGFRLPGDYKVRFKLPSKDVGLSTQDWLAEIRMGCYTSNFIDHGYDDVSFLPGITLKDLKDIGVDVRGHRKKLIEEIKALPHTEIEQGVPDDVERWLINLGLECYWESFQNNGYTTSRELEDLKPMDENTIRETLHIDKIGHLRKFMKALQRLQYPSETQRRIRETRKIIDEVTTKTLESGNLDEGREYQFWDGLRKVALIPESAIFGHDTELKEKLSDMRDSALMMFATANALWITIIFTLFKVTALNLLGTNPIGLAFLLVYGSIIVIQFITLLWHRLSTVCHFLARAPWKRGKMQKNWAFDDTNIVPPPSQQEINAFREQDGRRRRRRRQRTQSEEMDTPNESSSLLGASRGHNNYAYQGRSAPHSSISGNIPV